MSCCREWLQAHQDLSWHSSSSSSRRKWHQSPSRKVSWAASPLPKSIWKELIQARTSRISWCKATLCSMTAFCFHSTKCALRFCLQERQWKTSFARCHQAGVTLSGYLSIPTSTEKANSTSKDKFRGSKSREFHPSPCLPFNVTFQAASPREGIQALLSLLTISTVGELKSSILDIFTLIQKLPCCSFCRISSFSHILTDIGAKSATWTVLSEIQFLG